MVSAFWGCLAIAACVGASLSSDGRYALAIILAIQAILLALAAAFVSRSLVTVPCPKLDSGAEYIIGPSCLTYVLMLIRLSCASEFDGNTANFNFGIDCDDEGCQKSYAFLFNLNNIGHFLQGSLVFLLYEDLKISCAQMSQKSSRRCMFIQQILACGACVYPTYSLIKRIVKLDGKKFATCSHFNNVSEWACGFAIGVCAAYPFYAWLFTKRYMVMQEPSTIDRGFLTFKKLRISCGVSVFLSFLFTLVLMGLSWNSEIDQ